MNPAAQLPFTLEAARERLSQDPLAAWIGFQLDELEPGRVVTRMMVDPKHIAPNGFLHASVCIALADRRDGWHEDISRNFGDERGRVRTMASLTALDMVRRRLKPL